MSCSRTMYNAVTPVRLEPSYSSDLKVIFSPIMFLYHIYSNRDSLNVLMLCPRERSGSVVECLTRDQGAPSEQFWYLE